MRIPFWLVNILVNVLTLETDDETKYTYYGEPQMNVAAITASGIFRILDHRNVRFREIIITVRRFKHLLLPTYVLMEIVFLS